MKRVPIMREVHHGWNITWYRSLNRDMTQEKLSELTGISQRDISTFESEPEIDDDILEKFAKAFGIEIKYLRDVASYGTPVSFLSFYDQSQMFKDQSKNEVHNPMELVLDRMEKVYNQNTTNLVEAHNKTVATIIENHNHTTLILQGEIKELKDELKTERNK